MVYQIPFYQFPGLAKYGLALSCTADSDLAESGLARYAPPFDDRPPLSNSRIKGKAEENVWFSCWITLPKALGSHQLHT